MKKLTIGSRGSLLALAQANIVKDKILANFPKYHIEDIDIQVITTSGDRIKDRNLAEIGGKGLFTKEIEEALLAGTIDLAVHSMKDMPAFLTKNLIVSSYIEREDPRDAFISINEKNLSDLKSGSIVGTSSARRTAQILHMRRDLKIIPFRGNVTTRIEKLATHQVDATVLAMAGLNRLNIDSHLFNPIDTDLVLPAVAQGAIGVQIREDDNYIQELTTSFNSPETELCIICERAYLKALGASCTTSIAALATLDQNYITLKAQILKPDGSEVYSLILSAPQDDAIILGEAAAKELLSRIGNKFW